MTEPAMTLKQRETVEWLKKEIMSRDGHGDGYEYKQFEVVPCGSAVAVVTVVGLKEDEGTAAELVRRHRQIFVGKRGGLSAMQHQPSIRLVRGNAAFYVK